MVDPNVRLAYEQRDARDLFKPQFVKGIRPADWADVGAQPPIDWALAPMRPYYKCVCGPCGMTPANQSPSEKLRTLQAPCKKPHAGS